jgi:hypothetical protein
MGSVKAVGGQGSSGTVTLTLDADQAESLLAALTNAVHGAGSTSKKTKTPPKK